MSKLDTSKPYGTICGNHFASFEQDNKFFDHSGGEIKADIKDGIKIEPKVKQKVKAK